MQFQVHYSNLDHSGWMDQFIEKRVEKLKRYLSSSATVQVHLKYERDVFITGLILHSTHHDYVFSAEGANLFESFTDALDKAVRVLKEDKKKIRERVNKRYLAPKDELNPDWF